MRPGRQFYCKLVLKAEVDSNTCWTGRPTWLGRPCWPPKEVAMGKDVQWLPWYVLHMVGVCSNLGLGPKCE